MWGGAAAPTPGLRSVALTVDARPPDSWAESAAAAVFPSRVPCFFLTTSPPVPWVPAAQRSKHWFPKTPIPLETVHRPLPFSASPPERSQHMVRAAQNSRDNLGKKPGRYLPERSR